MSDAAKSAGPVILSWWSSELGNRESARARGLAARLRRAGPIDALAEGAVHDLARALNLRDGARLARLVCLLAEVREHVSEALPSRLGGPEPVLSSLRFQRLMRADEAELPAALRRAIVMADRQCNIAGLGTDLLHWNDRTRTRWCFQYFGETPPRTEVTETQA